MIVYDITREMFATERYPGDPMPRLTTLKSVRSDGYHLTRLSIGSHTGTHMDAPMHFIEGGRDAAGIDLAKCMGACTVVTLHGTITSGQMQKTLNRLGNPPRILFRGQAKLTEAAAHLLTVYQVKLVGFDDMDIAPEEVTDLVHTELLSNEVVILENLILDDIEDGRYFLTALPLKMAGLDGTPVRAVLMRDEE